MIEKEIVIGELQNAYGTRLPAIEAFIHLAARTHVIKESAADPMAAYTDVNVNGTLAALKLAQQAGATRFVFLSSVKVLGEETPSGQPFTENSPPKPEDAYGITKLMAEEEVKRYCEKAGMAWTIIRPPLIYGEGVKANFAKLVEVVRRGVPLPFKNVDNLRSIVYVKNLVDFLSYCLDTDKASNRIFLLDDGEALSIEALVREISQAIGRDARLFALPRASIEGAAHLLRKQDIYRRLFGSLELNSVAARATGWVAPYTTSEGLEATLKGELVDCGQLSETLKEP